MSSALRIRLDKGTIRELKIPKDKLDELQKNLSSPMTIDDVKKFIIESVLVATVQLSSPKDPRFT